jgi:hypothetical protein
MNLFRNFGVNHAKDVTGRCGIACAAYKSTPLRNSLISFNLQKIAQFWIGNKSVPLMEPWMDTDLHWIWAFPDLQINGTSSKRSVIAVKAWNANR